MPTPGRSVDDLPLAAYTTGVDPETEPAAMVAEMLAEPVAAAPFGAASALPGIDKVAEGDGRAASEAGPRPPFRELLQHPRAHTRDPRLLLSGVITVGAVLLAVSLLGGGAKPGTAAVASARPSTPVIPVTVDPGEATLVLTGSLNATYTLTGSAGQPAVGATVGAAWNDPLQNVLTLDGPNDRGTRTTDAGLVLTWGLMVDGRLVTFTSKKGECTIGMAMNPKNVSGSFACRKITSDDGKLTVSASGNYRT